MKQECSEMKHEIFHWRIVVARKVIYIFLHPFVQTYEITIYAKEETWLRVEELAL
jgi:hypothetical protein